MKRLSFLTLLCVYQDSSNPQVWYLSVFCARLLWLESSESNGTRCRTHTQVQLCFISEICPCSTFMRWVQVLWPWISLLFPLLLLWGVYFKGGTDFSVVVSQWHPRDKQILQVVFSSFGIEKAGGHFRGGFPFTALPSEGAINDKSIQGAAVGLQQDLVHTVWVELKCVRGGDSVNLGAELTETDFTTCTQSLFTLWRQGRVLTHWPRWKSCKHSRHWRPASKRRHPGFTLTEGRRDRTLSGRGSSAKQLMLPNKDISLKKKKLFLQLMQILNQTHPLMSHFSCLFCGKKNQWVSWMTKKTK